MVVLNFQKFSSDIKIFIRDNLVVHDTSRDNEFSEENNLFI